MIQSSIFDFQSPTFETYKFIDKDQEMSRAAHSGVITRIATLMDRYLYHCSQNEAYYRLFIELDVQFPLSGRRLRPDLCYFIHELPIDQHNEIYQGIPDLIVEAVSQTSYYEDTRIKRELYAHEGVPEYWIIFPETASINVYTLKDSVYELYSAGVEKGIIRSTILPDWELKLENVFVSISH